MMLDSKRLPLLVLLSIWSTKSITAVNISDCVTNPTGKVSFDVVGVPGPKGELGETGIQGQKGSSGEKGKKGARGYPGERGPVGGPGLPGVIGPRGYTGDTVLTEDEFARVIEVLKQNISSDIEDRVDKYINGRAKSKCGIISGNWRRVAYIDTTQGSPCPSGLREVTSSTLNKRACGRSVNGGCSSVTFPSGGSYTHVCGRARGYQHKTTDAFRAFNGNSINDAYVDGLSITRGSPRKHIWTYAAGLQEKEYSRGGYGYECPCAIPTYASQYKASFVGNDYYCESGFVTFESKTAWEDPLWDGEGCTQSVNTCCQRFGWFHKTVPLTSDNLEVRWCVDEANNEDFFTDIVEIWVL